MPVAASAAHPVAAAQRVLTEYGYGQLKPTGTVGSDTQAAKFERGHKLPVTGQISDRLVRDPTPIVLNAWVQFQYPVMGTGP
jgi:hypothetical protein